MLQNQRQVAGVWPIVHAEKLDDVGVADATEEEALGAETFLDRISRVGTRYGYLAVGEDVVEAFGDARHAVDSHFIDGAEAP